MTNNSKYDFSDDHRKMMVHIMHTGAFLDNTIGQMLKGFGITHVQFNILKVLEDKHPNALSVGEVKQGVLFTTSDITRLLDRLVSKELIERNICPDNRRQVNVNITDKGLELLHEIGPALLELTGSFSLKDFTLEEAQQIANYMKRIRKSIETNNQK